MVLLVVFNKAVWEDIFFIEVNPQGGLGISIGKTQ